MGQRFSALATNTGEPGCLLDLDSDYFFFLGASQDGRQVWWVCLRSAEGGESHTLSGIKISTLREYLQDLHPMKRGLTGDLPLLSALRAM